MDANEAREATRREDFPWHIGVFDAHCHPTDSMAAIDEISKMRAKVLTIMATRSQDQELVANVADRMGFTEQSLNLEEGTSGVPCRVLPSFGWHPWFSHQLYDDYNKAVESAPSKSDHYKSSLSPSPENDSFIASLPEPRPLSKYMERTKQFLQKHPLALVGEVGLDKSFRIPEPDAPVREDTERGLTPGGREGRRLSPHKVDLTHQRNILTAQLSLAGDLQRAVSVHGVAAHGLLFETLKNTWKGYEKEVMSKREKKHQISATDAHDHDEQKAGSRPYPPRICLHSYSGPPETLKQYYHPSVPTKIFVSFSQVINFSTSASSKALAVIEAVPDDRILVESDLHCAGQRMDDLLQSMVETVCETKNWSLEHGTKQLARNWRFFALGHDDRVEKEGGSEM